MTRTHRISTVLAVALFAMLVATGAGADRVQHSQHVELSPVADAPLRSGFVENIHAEGPKVYAQEIYVLNGAAPDATFDVAVLVHPFDPSCQGPPGPVIPTQTFETNGAGNGQGRETLTPEDVAGFPRGTHGVIWNIGDGSHTYVTACTPVTLD